MNVKEKINNLTNERLDKVIKGIIATEPCECGGEVVKHFRHRNDEWSGYFSRCTRCGRTTGGEV